MAITVDTSKHVIFLTDVPVGGLVSYNVVDDIYSEAKRLWLADETLSRMIFPFRPLGGDPLGGTLLLGKYVFIRNDLGWHIHPYDANHQLVVEGNLYQQDPDGRVIFEPFTVGKTINVIQERSSLTQIEQTAISGLTPTEALDIARIRKWALNEQYSDPSSTGPTAGRHVILTDDGLSIETTTPIWEDKDETTPYRGRTVERRGAFFST